MLINVKFKQAYNLEGVTVAGKSPRSRAYKE